MQLGYPVTSPVLVELQKVVVQLFFSEIVRGFQFEAAVSLLTWTIMMVLDWNEFTKLDSVFFVYFCKDLLVRFLLDRNPSLIDNLCSIRSEVEKEASAFYRTQEASSGSVEVTPIEADPSLRSKILSSTGVASTRVAASFNLVQMSSLSVLLAFNLSKSPRSHLLSSMRLLFLLEYPRCRMLDLRPFHHYPFMVTLTLSTYRAEWIKLENS